MSGKFRGRLGSGRVTVADIPVPFQDPGEHFVEGNQVRLLRNGGAAFPEMLSAIAKAERQILLEMYWFGSDQIGRKFAAALSAAANAVSKCRSFSMPSVRSGRVTRCSPNSSAPAHA